MRNDRSRRLVEVDEDEQFECEKIEASDWQRVGEDETLRIIDPGSKVNVLAFLLDYLLSFNKIHMRHITG